MIAAANRSDRSAEHVIREAIAVAVGRSETVVPLQGDRIVYTHANYPHADAVLATRIPQACQTCGGAEFMLGSPADDGSDDGLPCPDCPTIGTLLLWGWNVAKAKGHRGNYMGIYDDGWNDLLAELREVTP